MVLTVEQDNQLKETIKERYSLVGAREIASLFGVKDYQVVHRAKQLKIPGPRTLRRRENKENLNTEYFRTASYEMFYDLGFILGDGCIQKREGRISELRIQLKRTDEEVLVGLKKRLNSSHTIGRGQSVRNGTICYYSTIQICSNELVESLIGWGVLPRKGYLDHPLMYIPREYLGSFIRGYMDADGGMCQNDLAWEFGLVGTPLLIQGMRDILIAEWGLQENTLVIPMDTSNGIKKACWRDKVSLYKAYQEMYVNVPALPSLSRKRIGFERFIESLRDGDPTLYRERRKSTSAD